MAAAKLALFAAALIFVGFAAIVYPTNFTILDFVNLANLVPFGASAILFSLFLCVLTILAIANVSLIELSLLAVLSFGLCVFLVGLDLSILVLLTILYCYIVIQNTQLLKRPSPSFSASTNLPKLFLIFGVVFAFLVGYSAKPEFDPQLFASLEPFSETIVGCPAQTLMQPCLTQKVREQSQVEDAMAQCRSFPEPQRSLCIQQTNSQVDELISRTLAQYSSQGTTNGTIGDFLKSMAAKQMENIVGNDPGQLKLVFGVAAFSLVSTIGSFVTLLTSSLSSILMSIFLKVGFIHESKVHETVIHYRLV